MKKRMMGAALFAVVASVYAQNSAPVEEQATDATIEQDKNVDTILQDYLSSKGWGEKVNQGKNGIFVAMTGIGAIAAKPDSPSYNDARSRAFDKAMMDAKAKLAEYLESEISIAASYSYIEPPIGNRTADEELAVAIAGQDDDSILGKAKLLVSKKLDNLLKKEGYDVDAAKAAGDEKVGELKAKLAAVQGREAYQKIVKSCAKTALSGAQAFYTAEVVTGPKAEIGVILIWSPKLATMADSLVTGRPVPGAKPKKPIKEQINKDPDALLTTFGVQQKIDEKGEYVLVAFAQAAARSSASASANMARAKARQNAQAMIRSFAGETVVYSMAQEQAEETLDFGEGTIPDYNDQSSAERIIKTASAGMKINGIGTVHSWNARHPISGRLVYGVVATWSPSEAMVARKAKRMIESTARDGAAGRRSVRDYAPVSAKPTAKDRIKVVNEGDEDAF